MAAAKIALLLIYTRNESFNDYFYLYVCLEYESDLFLHYK